MNRATTESEGPVSSDDSLVAPAAPDPLDEAIARQREDLKQMFPLPPEGASRQRVRRARTGLVALALVVFLAWWADPAWQAERHVTTFGERREVLLGDGSQLTLDSATAVAVTWHLRSRRVLLETGRVRSAVAPSAWRPFSVDAGTVVARVVGTVFDVDRQADQVIVTVLRGRVRVAVGRDSGASTLLEAGQRVRSASEAGVLALQPVKPAGADFGAEESSAWVDGKLVFRATPLVQVLSELQRYRPEPLRVHGPDVAALQLSGVFDSSRAEQLLDLLPRILPVVVDRQRDGSVDIRGR